MLTYQQMKKSIIHIQDIIHVAVCLTAPVYLFLGGCHLRGEQEHGKKCCSDPQWNICAFTRTHTEFFSLYFVTSHNADPIHFNVFSSKHTVEAPHCSWKISKVRKWNVLGSITFLKPGGNTLHTELETPWVIQAVNITLLYKAHKPSYLVFIAGEHLFAFLACGHVINTSVLQVIRKFLSHHHLSTTGMAWN